MQSLEGGLTAQRKYTEFDRELRRRRQERLWGLIPIVLTFLAAMVVVAGLASRNSYVAGGGIMLFGACVYWNNRRRKSAAK